MNAMESLQKCYSIVGLTPPLPTQHLLQEVKRQIHPTATLKYLLILILKLHNFPCFGVKFPV